ncbi:transcription factor Pcc1-domain-containing protein [Scheffersomyces xylosifermentans]|uniref:transcription factor Pcc1-domain-containing protein n=1 Tax=Scheffersomyces xylosifermentans TaxID=1304137 RepID=UPI00315C909A
MAGVSSQQSVEELPYKLTLKVPFETARQALIASQTLSPDPILKGNELDVTYDAEDTTLLLKFSGISDRVIRVAISNVIDNLKTIVECIDEFDGKKDVLFEEE